MAVLCNRPGGFADSFRSRIGIGRAFSLTVAGARHFEELVCWRLSYELKLAVYEMCNRPPVKDDLRFVSQLRDAAASAPSNVAEGFGRRTDADFARFLDMARGSLMECQNHLRDAYDRRYVTADERDRVIVLAKRASGAVAGLQRHLRRRRH